jgi:UDP-glucose 4,6-dehydratase
MSSILSEWASLKQEWTAAGQGHVFAHESTLSVEERGALLADLKQFQPARLSLQFTTAMQNAAAPPSTSPPRPFQCVGEHRSADNWALGLADVAQGRAAALMLAGGQGTRLGSDAPKGLYSIGLPSGRTLFALQCERLQRVRVLAAERAGVPLADVHAPLLVLTSPATHDATVAAFRSACFYGLPEGDVLFFQQGTNPCFDLAGKVLLQSRSALALAPNGNGAVYEALASSGVLAELERRGVTTVHQFAVDNALVIPIDPFVVGAMQSSADSELLVKVVPRADKNERVGVFAQHADGGLCVLEYSEIPAELADQTGADGKLLYSASHICVNSFTTAFVRRIVGAIADKLPMHVAKKSIPALQADGHVASVPGVKLEAFIFDVFREAKHPIGMVVERDAEFAPLKNGRGAAADAPEHVLLAVARNAAARIQAVGGVAKAPFVATVTPSADSGLEKASATAPSAEPLIALYEISPLVSMCDYYRAQLDELARQCMSFAHAQAPLQIEPILHRPRNILVTGAAGFIASHVCIELVRNHPEYNVIGFDKLDYCSSTHNFNSIKDLKNFKFVRGNILSADLVSYVLKMHNVDTILHLAAQTHVDNSFGNSMQFSENNILGTHVLLECAKQHKIKRFVHISTDEVYGEVGPDETHAKESERLLAPTNPYAATKAAAEYLVLAYQKSFGMPVIITRGNNVYGPHQFPEKLIPKFSILLARQMMLPLHGDGSNLRNFLYCTDVARALMAVMHRGVTGQIYNIGTDVELTNRQVADELCRHFGVDPSKFVRKVEDRPFNDRRYAIDSTKMHLLAWRPLVSWKSGMAHTASWYANEQLVAAHWSRSVVDQVLVAHPRMGLTTSLP